MKTSGPGSFGIGSYSTPLDVDALIGTASPTGQIDPSTWTYQFTVMSSAVQQKPAERDSGDRLVPVVTCVWRTHWRPDIRPNMRLRSGSRIWRIEGVVNVGERNREMELLTVEEVKQQ
jgi:head-tail adaptor